MGDGWLKNLSDGWTYRFHRDEKSWLQDPKVFVDMGRPMSDGSLTAQNPSAHAKGPGRGHVEALSASG